MKANDLKNQNLSKSKFLSKCPSSLKSIELELPVKIDTCRTIKGKLELKIILRYSLWQLGAAMMRWVGRWVELVVY